jgi:hypothetical protein
MHLRALSPTQQNPGQTQGTLRQSPNDDLAEDTPIEQSVVEVTCGFFFSRRTVETSLARDARKEAIGRRELIKIVSRNAPVDPTAGIEARWHNRNLRSRWRRRRVRALPKGGHGSVRGASAERRQGRDREDRGPSDDLCARSPGDHGRRNALSVLSMT